MDLLLNGVYRRLRDGEQFRLLHIFQMEDEVVTISLDKKDSIPMILDLCEMKDELKTGKIQLVDDFDYSFPHTKSQTRFDRMEQTWQIIQSFVLDEPKCFIPKERNGFTSITAKQYGIARKSIQRYLYRYWAGGKTKYALLGNYQDNGKYRKNNPNKYKKLGNPGKYTSLGAGRNITEIDKKRIKQINESLYNKSAKYSSIFCYEALIEKYYTTPEGKRQEDAPTIYQFRYHSKKFINLKSRIGEKKFERENRATTGDSKSEVIGPGNVYQIDATIADVYLVSQDDPRRIIGRPVLYLVTDVFSHMIVGYSAALEGPSWTGAMSAIYNTIIDKVTLCNHYGIQIEEYEWPCSGIPSKILADNGEMRSKASDGIIRGIGIGIANTASWRPDLKGIVENSFKLFHGKTKPIMPGAVYPDMKERGGPDYTLDAKLNLFDFNQIMIHYILGSNSRLIQRHPQLDPDTIRDKIQAVPIELWNWGIRNRSGIMPRADIEQVKIALMQKAQGRVTAKGIKFKNLYYTCPYAMENSWFSEARTRKTWTCNIAYDPRTSEEICLLLDNGKYEYCTRTSSCEDQFIGWSLEEIGVWYENNLIDRKTLEKQIAQDSSIHQNNIKAVIESARKRTQEYEDHNLKQKTKKDIRINRANELVIEREKEAFRSPQRIAAEAKASDSAEKKASTIVDYSAILAKIQREKREGRRGDDQ